MEENKFIIALRTSELLIIKDLKYELSENMKDKLNVENALFLFKIADVFSLPNLYEATLSYTYRSFTMVTKTQSFLELDFLNVANILKSSQLLVTSELEVFNAAEDWINYNSKERSKFSKDLLSKVRLSLLSDHALKFILQKNSKFCENDECVKIINDMLRNKERFNGKKSCIGFTNRDCDQKKFDILVCGGVDCKGVRFGEYNGYINHFDGNNFKSFKQLNLISRGRDLQAAVIENAVYFFGGFGPKQVPIVSVEKYSFTTNDVEKVCDMYDNRWHHCVCPFMNKVFVIGGSNQPGKALNYCLEFETKDCSWKEVAGTIDPRDHPACAVFQGKLVVSGGMDTDTRDYVKSVEVYDHVADKWSLMPSLNFGRCQHSSVAVRNKLFVSPGFGHPSCEVFDTVCNKFVVLKRDVTYTCAGLVSLENKLFVFSNQATEVICYNVETEEWSEAPFKATEHLRGCCVIKIPQL